MSVKTHFYRDYFALESWDCQRGIRIACHHTVNSLIIKSADCYPDDPLVAPYVERARGIVYYSPAELRDNFRDAGNVLWLTVGASICGITLKESDLAGSVNRWIGVAGCAAFNDGYSNISLYQWKDQKLTRTNWLFKDGVLEPREPYTAPLEGLI